MKYVLPWERKGFKFDPNDRRVLAIRNSKTFGRGSASVIDEAWEDEMLQAMMNVDRINTPREALVWAMEIHDQWMENMGY